MRFTLRECFFDALKNLLCLMNEKQHRTGWFAVPVEWEVGGTGRVFALITVDEDRAKKIEETLDAAGLLCHEELGPLLPEKVCPSQT